jgi:hypothetical protein
MELKLGQPDSVVRRQQRRVRVALALPKLEFHWRWYSKFRSIFMQIPANCIIMYDMTADSDSGAQEQDVSFWT